MKRRSTVILSVSSVLVVLFLIFSISTIESLISPPPPSYACKSTSSYSYVLTGYTVVCGSHSASDGRLSITVHGYYYNDAQHIQFQRHANEGTILPTSVFLIVNATIANIGSGNASITGGFYVVISNGSAAPITNTIWLNNASFPGSFPNQSILVMNGGYYLPPGKEINSWLLFFTSSHTTMNSTSVLKLQELIYLENFYGGYYLGGGQYAGSPKTVNDEFIITP